MTRRTRAAAVLVAALLVVPLLGPSASAQQPELSQVVCLASGKVFVPAPHPAAILGIRTTGIAVRGKGTCVKVSTHSAEFPAVVFGVDFEGEGFTRRTGPCLAGVIFRQDIFVDYRFEALNDPSDVRFASHLWTTELNVDITEPTFDPIIQVPSLYPPTHFQIRHPVVRGNLRGAGAYVEEIDEPIHCPQSQEDFIPALFAFTFTGGDIAGP